VLRLLYHLAGTLGVSYCVILVLHLMKVDGEPKLPVLVKLLFYFCILASKKNLIPLIP
jgi:hypothetical protein